MYISIIILCNKKTVLGFEPDKKTLVFLAEDTIERDNAI